MCFLRRLTCGSLQSSPPLLSSAFRYYGDNCGKMKFAAAPTKRAGNPDWVDPTPEPTAFPLSFSFGYGSGRRALAEEAAFEHELESSPEKR